MLAPAGLLLILHSAVFTSMCGSGSCVGVVGRCAALKFMSAPAGEVPKMISWVPAWVAKLSQHLTTMHHVSHLDTKQALLVESTLAVGTDFKSTVAHVNATILKTYTDVTDNCVVACMEARVEERNKYELMSQASLSSHLKIEHSCTVAFGSSKGSLVNKVMALSDEKRAKDYCAGLTKHYDRTCTLRTSRTRSSTLSSSTHG